MGNQSMQGLVAPARILMSLGVKCGTTANFDHRVDLFQSTSLAAECRRDVKGQELGGCCINSGRR